MAGGDKFDTEDLGARGKIQRIKVITGALDTDGGDVTSANPFPINSAAEGAVADAAVVGDLNGSLSAKLRGLSKIFADIWNNTLHGLSVTQIAATPPPTTNMQSAATANANGSSLVVTGYATAILQIASSPAMSGGTIVNFESSVDGVNWQPILAHQIGQQGNQATTTSTDGDYRLNVAGFTAVRARISNYSAGSVTIIGSCSPLAGTSTTVGISGANDTAQTDATQTTSIGSFIKGSVKIFADVWDSVNHLFNVSLATKIAGEDLTNDVIKIEQQYSYIPPITTATTTTVKSGAGYIDEIIIAGGTLGAVTIYDNTAGSGTVIFPTLTPVNGQVLIRHVKFNIGLTIVTAAATSIVGSYR